MATAVQSVNPNADVIGKKFATAANVSAAKGLADVVSSNLGPKGTMKMLVGGAGQIKITKDGKQLLDEMQIQHPTAAVIARTATAQDDITGDGTTSIVLFVGELMKQADRYLAENVHPRLLTDGMELAREFIVKFLDTFKTEMKEITVDALHEVARTALRTKLPAEVADHMTPIIVSAVQTIRKFDPEHIDLHMIEIMHMRHRSALDSQFIDGLVLDHGSRHPDMQKRNEDCFIFSCNVSLEYEKTEVNSEFFYKSAEERARMAIAERAYTDEKVQKIIDLKRKVIDEDPNSKGKSFILINQKGIDPPSLELLQAAGIVGIRRAKKRNQERLQRACGGYAVNSVEDLDPSCLGFAKLVYEHHLGDEVYTFVEGTQNPTSCTILIRGPNDHTIAQIKAAVRDGLRAVLNAIEDQALVPGAGAFELAAHHKLMEYKMQVPPQSMMGVQAFADALLVIPKTLAENSGLDALTTLHGLLKEVREGHRIGIDIDTGKALLPASKGIWDNLRVKKQLIHLGTLIAVKLLLVDEIIRAGRKMKQDQS